MPQWPGGPAPDRRVNVRWVVAVGRMWGYILAASATVLGEIAISVTANLIEVPKGYYAIPIAAAVIYVAGTAIAKAMKEQAQTAPTPRSARPAHVNLDSPAYVDPASNVLSGFDRRWVIAGGAVACFPLVFAEFCFGGHQAGSGFGRNIFAGTVLLICAIAVAVIFLILSRVSLEFSRYGIRIKSIGRHRSISWTEATNFRVQHINDQDSDGGEPWLAATAIPRSTSFRQQWGYDDISHSLLLCNLRATGIKPHRVEGALGFWSPNS